LLLGFAITLMTGMLLKIIPFLVWLNLQQTWIKYPSKKMPLSNMQQVVPNTVARRQYVLFILMLVFMLVLASGLQNSWVVKLAALIALANFSYLVFNLSKANRLYSRLYQKIETN
jgi:Ca2+/Na+ antiporter